MHIGDHEVFARPEDARELRVDRNQIVDVGEGETRDDQVGFGGR